MFWSPAVMTLIVTRCCASAAPARVSAMADPSRADRNVRLNMKAFLLLSGGRDASHRMLQFCADRSDGGLVFQDGINILFLLSGSLDVLSAFRQALAPAADHQDRGDDAALERRDHVCSAGRSLRPHQQMQSQRRQAALGHAGPGPPEISESQAALITLFQQHKASLFQSLPIGSRLRDEGG